MIKAVSIVMLVITLFISVCFCADYAIESESDTEFEKFLNSTIESYDEWLTRNGNDPSPLITDIVLLSQEAGSLKVFCELRNQSMVNHSKTINDFVDSESNFTEHYFGVKRNISTPYQFQGEINCNGVILASGYEDLEKDVTFYGIGNWTIGVNASSETVTVFNVGIMSNGSFDLSHSWIQYQLLPVFHKIEFSGAWEDMDGDGEIDKHAGKVLNLFQNLYLEYLRESWLGETNDFNPSKRLLLSYLIDNVIKKTNVFEIISGEPPPTYSPTQRTTAIPTDLPSTTTTTPPLTSSTGMDERSSTFHDSGTIGITINSDLVYFTLIITAYHLTTG